MVHCRVVKLVSSSKIDKILTIGEGRAHLRMIALADKWNEKARMRRVMAKTLQQARQEKI